MRVLSLSLTYLFHNTNLYTVSALTAILALLIRMATHHATR